MHRSWSLLLCAIACVAPVCAQSLEVTASGYQIEWRDEGFHIGTPVVAASTCYVRGSLKTYVGVCNAFLIPPASFGKTIMRGRIMNEVRADGKTYRLWCEAKNTKSACRGLEPGATFHASIKGEYMQIDKRSRYFISDILGTDGHSLTPVAKPVSVWKMR